MRLSLEKRKTVKVPGDPDGGYIEIKALNVEEIAAIESRATETVMSGSDDVRVVLNNFKRINETAKACLCGWGNLYDEKGNEMAFNPSNIREAARFAINVDGRHMRFLEWVDHEHSKFVKEVRAEEEEAEKN